MKHFAAIVKRLLTALNAVNYYARCSLLDVSRAMDTPIMSKSCFLILLTLILLVPYQVSPKREDIYDLVDQEEYSICFVLLYSTSLYYTVNPFVPNAPFLNPLKTSEHLMVFRYFQGVEKGCIGNKWVKVVSVPQNAASTIIFNECLLDENKIKVMFV